MIYKEIAAVVPPYFTGLSVFAGLGVFGLSGVVYGPVRNTAARLPAFVGRRGYSRARAWRVVGASCVINCPAHAWLGCEREYKRT